MVISTNLYANTVDKANLLIKEGKYKEGANILFNLATKKNNPRAFYELGHLWSNGIGLKKSDKRAFQAFMKGANLGNGDAQNSVGSFYYNGRYVKKDYEKAFHWFVKAAKNENTYAMDSIGGMYLKGYGVEKDQDQAIRWFKIAAKHGNDHAAGNLIGIFENIAKQGDVAAMHNLGLILTNIKGKRRDVKEGIKWYEKAAKKDFEASRKALINIYTLGMYDFSPNKKKAEYWKSYPTNGSE